MARPKLKLDIGALQKNDVVNPDDPDGMIASGFAVAYKLGAVIGSGTTAVVKRCVRLKDTAGFAVKCIASADEEVRQFARDEYELLLSLRHPGIVHAETFFDAPHHLWMVMELCDGGNLQSYVDNRGPFAEVCALDLFEQKLKAVDFLHQRRVVHRDLKPENCLLCREGTQLKLSDFNSAKVLGQGAAMLTERGTHAYAAPEVVLHQDWNERVDIWACGLCLFFMVSGRLPFNCRGHAEKLAFAEERLPGFVWPEGATDNLKELGMLCLAASMKNRPAAMSLLQHPAFSEEKVSWFDRLNQELANSFCCSAGKKHLKRPVAQSLAKMRERNESLAATTTCRQDEHSTFLSGIFESIRFHSKSAPPDVGYVEEGEARIRRAASAPPPSLPSETSCCEVLPSSPFVAMAEDEKICCEDERSGAINVVSTDACPLAGA